MRILIALLLAAQVWGAAFTSVRSGNWHDANGAGATSPWCSVGTCAIPGDGDTVSVANTHTVTCEAGQTCTAGLGTSISSIRLASVTVTAPGTCTVAPTLTVSGGTGTQAILTATLSGTDVVPSVASHGWYTVAPTTVTPSGGTCTVQPTITIGGGDTVAAVTAAIQLNASGVLAIGAGATLVAKGDVLYTQGASNTTDAITLAAGSTWRWSAPAGVHYRFGASANTAYRGVTFNGTSGSRVTVVSDLGGGEGLFGCGNGTYCGKASGDYVDFIRIGTAYDYAWEFEVSTTNDISWNLQHGTFTNCGCIYAKNTLNTDHTFIHNHNTHQGTVSSLCSLFVQGSTAIGTGTREVVGNYFDKLALGATAAPTTTQLWGFTISDNIFMGGANRSGTGGREWAGFARNVVRNAQMFYYPAFSDSYLVSDDDAGNPHYAEMTPNPQANLAVPIEVSGCILENTNRAKPATDWGDCLLVGGRAQTPQLAVGVHNNISLPAGGGDGSCTLITFFSTNSASFLVSLDHDTVYTGTGVDTSTNGGGRVALMENSTNATAGSVPSLRSNAAWSAAPASYAWVFDVANKLDLITVADYNLEHNILDTSGNNSRYGYKGNFTAAPGAHDLWSVNPRFADPYRVFGRFTTDYLGNSASNGAWTSGQTYTNGQTVTHSAATYYAGTTLLYRRVGTAGAEDATTEPGVGAIWRTHWEFATIQDLGTWHAATTGAGKTITDGAIGCSGCSPAEAMVKWVRRGYVPQNPAVWKAGHDGKTIGAVDVSASYPAMVGAII